MDPLTIGVLSASVLAGESWPPEASRHSNSIVVPGVTVMTGGIA